MDPMGALCRTNLHLLIVSKSFVDCLNVIEYLEKIHILKLNEKKQMEQQQTKPFLEELADTAQCGRIS